MTEPLRCFNCGSTFLSASGLVTHRKICLTAIARFWSRVIKSDDDGCWLWTGPFMKYRGGYGQMTIAKKAHKAHRVAFVLAYGPFPNDLHVLHHCDNPPCVRPSHLFVGTRSDNMRDAASKGRHAQQKNPELQRRMWMARWRREEWLELKAADAIRLQGRSA